MLPIVHGLEAEYWEQIDFVYLDHLDRANRPVMEEYGFRWRPQYIFIEPDGTEIRRWLGFVGSDEFREAFDEYLTRRG